MYQTGAREDQRKANKHIQTNYLTSLSFMIFHKNKLPLIPRILQSLTFCISILFIISFFPETAHCKSNNNSLQGAPETISTLLLSMTESEEDPSPHQSDENSLLLHEIHAFKQRHVDMDAKKTAQRWLDLVKKYWELSPSHLQGGGIVDAPYSEENHLSFMTLLEAIPGPDFWTELQAGILNDPLFSQPPSFSKSGLKSILFFINGSFDLFDQEILVMQDLAQNLDFLKKESALEYISKLKSLSYRATFRNPPEALRNQFKKVLELKQQSGAQKNEIELPPLMSLLPPEEARKLIEESFTIPNVWIKVPGSGMTLEVAKNILKERLESLTLPQWQLVTSPDDVALFEALDNKFPITASDHADQNLRNTFDNVQHWEYTSLNKEVEAARQRASMMYIIGLLTQQRVDDAVAFTAKLQKTSFPGYRFARALRTINQSQYQQEIFTYCLEVLKHNPAIDLWEQFRHTGISAGKSSDVISTIDTHLESYKPGSTLYIKLLAEKIATDLALGHVEHSIVQIQKALAVEFAEIVPSAHSTYLATYNDLCLYLIRLGKLANNPLLIEEGLDTLQDNLNRFSDTAALNNSYKRSSMVHQICDALIGAKRFSKAEELLTTEMNKKLQQIRGRELEFALGKTSLVRDELLLLLSLYHSANRPKDVLYLLDKFPWWGGKDLQEIATEQVMLLAAESLHSEDKSRDAEVVLKAHLESNPSNDAFYRLLTQIKGSDLIPWLYEIYARDRFEERPLIWIAHLLHQEGKYHQAEEVIRQALKVDPTDGEQKAGDRVYAYSVLSKILHSLGREKDSLFFRDVVKAVRVAERGDEYRQIGILEKSLAKYSEAQLLFRDAYCVQWRLAERMYELGRFSEAKTHYELAFERMPEQFGQVASFCFGCANVFDNKHSRSIAEEVLIRLEKTTPARPQVFYLLGQLRESQNNLSAAYKCYSKAVTLDQGYLDAWKKIFNLQDRIFTSQTEKDEIALKILSMDPLMRHHRPDFRHFVNVADLWRTLEANQKYYYRKQNYVYPLRAGRQLIERYEQKALKLFPERLRIYKEYGEAKKKHPMPCDALRQNSLITQIIELMSVTENFY